MNAYNMLFDTIESSESCLSIRVRKQALHCVYIQ